MAKKCLVCGKAIGALSKCESIIDEGSVHSGKCFSEYKEEHSVIKAEWSWNIFENWKRSRMWTIIAAFSSFNLVAWIIAVIAGGKRYRLLISGFLILMIIMLWELILNIPFFLLSSSGLLDSGTYAMIMWFMLPFLGIIFTLPTMEVIVRLMDKGQL
jgi:hypothetical protein